MLGAAQQRSRSDTAIEVLELHPNEMQLIKLIRKSVRFGEVTIAIREGIPRRIVRITESITLDTA